jgi:DNA methylase
MPVRDRILELKRVRAGDLAPHESNPRRHPEVQRRAVEGSLATLGQVAPLLAYREGDRLRLFDGHLRREIDPESQVTVAVTDLSPAEARQALATLDRSAALADTDEALLSDLLRQVREDAAAGVLAADARLDGLLADLTRPTLLTDPDALPEQVAPRAKRGDVWLCGEHRVMCGDATRAEDVARLMDGERADLVFADPPYGINIVSVTGHLNSGAGPPFRGARGHVSPPTPRAERSWGPTVGSVGSHGGKGLGAANGSKPFGQVAAGPAGKTKAIPAGVYHPVVNDDGPETAIATSALLLEMFPKAVHVWWGGNFYAHALPPSSCWLVWDKENTACFADAELAWTNQTTAVRIFQHQWNGLMRDSERGEKRVHPTQKPVALAEWCLEKYGEGSDVVLDPLFGSGMSLIACERLGKRWRGMELVPEYVDVALARWEAATGRQATLANATDA